LHKTGPRPVLLCQCVFITWER